MCERAGAECVLGVEFVGGGGGEGGRMGGLLISCEFTFNSVPGWGKKIREFSAVRVTVNQKS